MLFSRYAGGVEQILQYEYKIGIEIINKAYEKENEEKIFQRWVFGYEKEMGYEEFKSKLTGLAKIKMDTPRYVSEDITEKEILEKVKSILEMGR